MEFLPKILATINKKLKDNDNVLHANIGDALASITEHALKNLTI